MSDREVLQLIVNLLATAEQESPVKVRENAVAARAEAEAALEKARVTA